MSRQGAWGYRCSTCREWIDLTPEQARTLTLEGRRGRPTLVVRRRRGADPVKALRIVVPLVLGLIAGGINSTSFRGWLPPWS